MAYWLMKTEPSTFSVDDLAARPGQTEPWDGVRNYQARNMMRDEMRRGDGVLLYHSSTAVPGIAGIAEVVREAYPDASARNPQSPYYDAKADDADPRWYCVDVRLVRKLDRVIALSDIREHAAHLGDLALLRRGNRLSVMPVSAEQWSYLLGLERG